MRMAAEGAQKLLEACKTIVKDQGQSSGILMNQKVQS